MEFNLEKTLKNILTDIISIFCVISFLLILNYFNAFPEMFQYYIDLDKVLIAMALFSIIWLVFGIIMLVIGHAFAT